MLPEALCQPALKLECVGPVLKAAAASATRAGWRHAAAATPLIRSRIRRRRRSAIIRASPRHRGCVAQPGV